MELDLTSISELLQTIGGGGLTAIVLVLGVLGWRFGPKWLEGRDRDVAARERDNRLRKIHIRLMRANLEFLKEQGHEVEIPDITEEI